MSTARQGSFRRVLVPIDFATEPERALAAAAAIRADDAWLTLLHAIAPVNPKRVDIPGFDLETFDARCAESAERDLRPLVSLVGAERTETVIPIGHPAEEIVARAEHDDSDLIVMTTSHRRGLSRLFLGSVAEEVLRRTRCSVLTVPTLDADAARAGRHPFPIRSIVVPVDLSGRAWTGVHAAIEIAVNHGAEVHVLHVVDERGGDVLLPGLSAGPNVVNLLEQGKTYAKDLITAEVDRIRGAASSLKVEGHALLGHPANAIADFAAGRDADLVVLSSQGRSGLADQLLGSTAERVVRRVGCPVLTVRDRGATDESDESEG